MRKSIKASSNTTLHESQSSNHPTLHKVAQNAPPYANNQTIRKRQFRLKVPLLNNPLMKPIHPLLHLPHNCHRIL
jgi:hypothetical protein